MKYGDSILEIMVIFRNGRETIQMISIIVTVLISGWYRGTSVGIMECMVESVSLEAKGYWDLQYSGKLTSC